MSGVTIKTMSTIHLYRRLLTLAKRLPQDKKGVALEKIRLGFRENAQEADTKKIEKLVENGNSALGYLRMITPKSNTESRIDVSENEKNSLKGRVRLVYREGHEGPINVEEIGNEGQRERAAHTNWHGGNLDPDSVARHYHQLDRMGFRDNAHAKGIF